MTHGFKIFLAFTLISAGIFVSGCKSAVKSDGAPDPSLSSNLPNNQGGNNQPTTFTVSYDSYFYNPLRSEKWKVIDEAQPLYLGSLRKNQIGPVLSFQLFNGEENAVDINLSLPAGFENTVSTKTHLESGESTEIALRARTDEVGAIESELEIQTDTKTLTIPVKAEVGQ